MEQYADLPFPMAGLDLNRSVVSQAPGTTLQAVNVRLVEAMTLRARGGTRPGLSKQPAGQVPHGPAVLQDLNAVFHVDALALPGSFPPPNLDPVTGLPPVVDPSTPGDPGSWGVGTPLDGTTGLPALDPNLGTPLPPFASRNPSGVTPGGGNVPPRKHRQGGDGDPPNPNVLMYRPENAGPHRLFHGDVQIQIHKSAPDPLGWNGTEPAFGVDACYPYNPPLIPAPTTAFVLQPVVFLPFKTIQQQIDAYLDGHNVRPCTYTIVYDTVQPPGPPC